MSINDVTVHLDMLVRTEAGTVFGNVDEKVIALRWQSFADAAAAEAVVGLLGAEFSGSGADTLIYDTRRIAVEEASELDDELRMRAIAQSHARQVGWIVANPDLPLPPAVVEFMAMCGIHSCVGTTFEEVARKLKAFASCSGNLLSEGIANFSATYAGSSYSIPELRATVLRSAGNFYDMPLAGALYKTSFELHAKSGGIAFIIDTSAIAPIHNVERYSFSFEALILPITRMGSVQQLVHVRAGDPLFPTGQMQLQQLASSMDSIEVAETETMAQALDIIRVTQGRKTVAPASEPVV
jgi:hypothetical protein